MSNPNHKKAGKRSTARLAVVQALYELDMTGGSADAVLKEFLSDRWRDRLLDRGEDLSENFDPAAEPDGEMVADLLHQVTSQGTDLNATIDGALKDGQAFDRLQTLLQCILRAGLAELMAHPETDRAVIVNEYVEVTRAFYADGPETGLINAVLDNLAGSVTFQLPLQAPKS